MMFSTPSKSPFVMKRFTPSISQISPSTCRAFVRAAPTSLPASGSVSTIDAPQRCSMRPGRKRFFCSAEPCWSMVRAAKLPSR
jgi:hypothetical protein